MRFSPSTLGWYPEDIHYPNLPGDVITVPDTLWRDLLGKPLEVGPDGLPREKVLESQAVVPTSVTMRQARLALLTANRLAQVETALAALPSPQREAAQIEWEFAATVERASPLVGVLAAATGMNDDELDQLFMLAATF